MLGHKGGSNKFSKNSIMHLQQAIKLDLENNRTGF